MTKTTHSHKAWTDKGGHVTITAGSCLMRWNAMGSS